MDKLIVARTLVDLLANVDQRVEVCDEAGKTVGWFDPAARHVSSAGYECPLSEQDLDRIERAGGGRPLGDVLADLEKRA